MSQKNHVFEALFSERFDPDTGVLENPIVTLQEVSSVIRDLADKGVVTLSPNNPANFIKDYLRSTDRNELWPKIIRDAGYTARQTTGEGLCFQFVALGADDEPFPDDFSSDGTEHEFLVQTLSLPVTTRDIVRVDEQSLAQIVVKQQVMEHFLAASPKAVGWGILEVTHLQNNVKLRNTEIDALYKAVRNVDGVQQIGAVSVEVKISDPIIAEQIEKQAIAVLDDPVFEFCIPVILKRLRKGEFIAMHLDIVQRPDLNDQGGLDIGDIAFSAIYRFSPALPKI